MRICLISTEIFAWGKFGGFGRATRMIGGELVKRGVEVIAVVPQRPGQRAGRATRRNHRARISAPSRPQRMLQLFRESDADVYHSCEISLGTYLARRAMPDRRHMITFRDPRDIERLGIGVRAAVAQPRPGARRTTCSRAARSSRRRPPCGCPLHHRPLADPQGRADVSAVLTPRFLADPGPDSFGASQGNPADSLLPGPTRSAQAAGAVPRSRAPLPRRSLPCDG